jgi:cell division protein ZapE
MAVRELYQRRLAERGYTADAAQLRAIDALERCENEWLGYLRRRGNTCTAGSAAARAS